MKVVMEKTPAEIERERQWILETRPESFVFGQMIGREEGMEKGMEEGRLLERQNMVLSLHAEGFQLDAICRITNFSAEEIRRIIASH